VSAAEQRLSTVERRILKTKVKLQTARAEIAELLKPGNHRAGE
jgi:hypothetical protein